MQSSSVPTGRHAGRSRHRAVVLVLLATAASLVFAGSARAATDASYASAATAYQNSTIAAALARAPGGTRVAPDTVEWSNPSVILKVPSTADATTVTPLDGTFGCPSSFNHQWTCVYSGTGGGGRPVRLQDAGPPQYPRFSCGRGG